MTTETTLPQLIFDGKRGIKLTTGEHVATVDAWACACPLRAEIVRRFNEFKEPKK